MQNKNKEIYLSGQKFDPINYTKV